MLIIFSVHEDDSDDDIVEVKCFPKESLEDYSDWKVLIRYPEPPNPNMIPMYPKHRVYCDPNTEYSIEELRAERYSEAIRHQMAIEEQEILEGVELMQESLHEVGFLLVIISEIINSFFQLKNDIFQRSVTNQAQQNELMHRTLVQDQHNGSLHQSIHPSSSSQNFNLQSPVQKQTHVHNQLATQSLPYGSVTKNDLLNASSSQVGMVPYSNESLGAATSSNFELWCSVQKPPNFCIYEQSMTKSQEQISPKGKRINRLFIMKCNFYIYSRKCYENRI